MACAGFDWCITLDQVGEEVEGVSELDAGASEPSNVDH